MTDRLDERTLDEIGHFFDEETHRDGVRLPQYVINAAIQRVVERGLLIPRAELAEVEWERDAYKIAHQLVTEECSHWASETAKHRDFLAKYIEVATEREQELGLRCAALESRLQMAQRQGVAEKAANELFDREIIARLRHEDWCRLKREEGFHGPGERCPVCKDEPIRTYVLCANCRLDIIPWEQLPEMQKAIRRDFDAVVLPYFEQQAQAAIAAVVEKVVQILIELSGEGDEVLSDAIRRVRSLAPQSAQDALREAKAAARKDGIETLTGMIRAHFPDFDPASVHLMFDALREAKAEAVNANHSDWLKLLLGRDSLPLPTTPQGVVKEHDAKVIDAALDRLWELMRDGWGTQKAMDKVKEALK